MRATLPHIQMVRVKRIDCSDPSFRRAANAAQTSKRLMFGSSLKNGLAIWPLLRLGPSQRSALPQFSHSRRAYRHIPSRRSFVLRLVAFLWLFLLMLTTCRTVGIKSLRAIADIGGSMDAIRRRLHRLVRHRHESMTTSRGQNEHRSRQLGSRLSGRSVRAFAPMRDWSRPSVIFERFLPWSRLACAVAH
jgi:hypothetical protein